MNSKSPHISVSVGLKKPLISNRHAKFFALFIRKAIFAPVHPSSFILLPLLLTGCGTTPREQPVVVNVTGEPAQGGRFRAAERQRDVWIAPQATDSDTLLHEQTVTFVEKPQTWQLPSTIEPHTLSNPDLPLEQGDYDGEVLRRQREMIDDREKQITKAASELENLKRQSQESLNGKDKQVQESEQKLKELHGDLAAALQKLESIEEAERLRKAQEEEKRNKKHWWKLW